MSRRFEVILVIASLLASATGTAMTTPTMPNSMPPARKQKITNTGLIYAASPSTIGPKNSSIEMRSAMA